MRLLIDIGNTRIKYVYDNGSQLLDISTIDNQQISEMWFKRVSYKVNEIIVANVSQSSLTETLIRWSKKADITLMSVKSEKAAFGVKTAYQQPNQLGVDRWLALIGARTLYPDKNILIIDAGTATTVDLLNKNGQHQGGWILPGVDTMFTSLFKDTAHVLATKEKKVTLGFGHNTTECVNNACWMATVACIKQAKIEAEKYGTIDVTFLIGGNSAAINELLDQKLQRSEQLIFLGLQRYSTN